MGILSNISLEVIWIQCIWLQLLTVKPVWFMKKRIQCWQEYKSNCHPWHFHFSFSRQGELWCLGLSGRRAQLSCWCSAVPKARRCQKYCQQTHRQVPVLALPVSSVQFVGQCFRCLKGYSVLLHLMQLNMYYKPSHYGRTRSWVAIKG